MSAGGLSSVIDALDFMEDWDFICLQEQTRDMQDGSFHTFQGHLLIIGRTIRNRAAPSILVHKTFSPHAYRAGLRTWAWGLCIPLRVFGHVLHVASIHLPHSSRRDTSYEAAIVETCSVLDRARFLMVGMDSNCSASLSQCTRSLDRERTSACCAALSRLQLSHSPTRLVTHAGWGQDTATGGRCIVHTAIPCTAHYVRHQTIPELRAIKRSEHVPISSTFRTGLSTHRQYCAGGYKTNTAGPHNFHRFAQESSPPISRCHIWPVQKCWRKCTGTGGSDKGDSHAVHTEAIGVDVDSRPMVGHIFHHDSVLSASQHLQSIGRKHEQPHPEANDGNMRFFRIFSGFLIESKRQQSLQFRGINNLSTQNGLRRGEHIFTWKKKTKHQKPLNHLTCATEIIRGEQENQQSRNLLTMKACARKAIR